ncbi:MAG TPA: hypothetical protein VIS72_17745, partial [Anaerolineales bacterium]
MHSSDVHPRIVFRSIEIARKASPFFIDEEGVGPWLSSPDKELYSLGTVITTSRNAIHIPSLEQTGARIPESMIMNFCQRAASIGLGQVRNATGYWTLASSGILQKEEVKIASSHDKIDLDSLR